MYSLIITLISIALVVLLAFAATWYGGSLLTAYNSKAAGQALVVQAQQIYAAASLYYEEKHVWPASIEDLRGEYLKEIPIPPKGALITAQQQNYLISNAWADDVTAANWAVNPTLHAVVLEYSVIDSVCQSIVQDFSDTVPVERIPETRQAQFQERSPDNASLVPVPKGIANLGDVPIPGQSAPGVPVQCYGSTTNLNTMLFTGPYTPTEWNCSQEPYKSDTALCPAGPTANEPGLPLPGYWVWRAQAHYQPDTYSDNYGLGPDTYQYMEFSTYNTNYLQNMGWSEDCPSGGAVVSATPAVGEDSFNGFKQSGATDVDRVVCIPALDTEVTAPTRFAGLGPTGVGAEMQAGREAGIQDDYPAGAFDRSSPVPNVAYGHGNGVAGSLQLSSGTYVITAMHYGSLAYTAGWDATSQPAGGAVVGVAVVESANAELTIQVPNYGAQSRAGVYSGSLNALMIFDSTPFSIPKPYTGGYWVVDLYADISGTGVASAGAINHGWKSTCPSDAIVIDAYASGTGLAENDPYNLGAKSSGSSVTSSYCIPGVQSDPLIIQGEQGSTGDEWWSTGGMLTAVPMTLNGENVSVTSGIYPGQAMPSLRSMSGHNPYNELSFNSIDAPSSDHASVLNYAVYTQSGWVSLFAGAFNYYAEKDWDGAAHTIRAVKVGAGAFNPTGGSSGSVAYEEYAYWQNPVAWYTQNSWSSNPVILNPVYDGVQKGPHLYNNDSVALHDFSIVLSPSFGPQGGGFPVSVSGRFFDGTTQMSINWSSFTEFNVGSATALAIPSMPPSTEPFGGNTVEVQVSVLGGEKVDTAEFYYQSAFNVLGVGDGSGKLLHIVPGNEAWLKSGYTSSSGVSHYGGFTLTIGGGGLCSNERDPGDAVVTLEAGGTQYTGTILSCYPGATSPFSYEVPVLQVSFPVIEAGMPGDTALVTVSRNGQTATLPVALNDLVKSSSITLNNRWGNNFVIAGGIFQFGNPLNAGVPLPGSSGYKPALQISGTNGVSARCTYSLPLDATEAAYFASYGTTGYTYAWLCEKIIPEGVTSYDLNIRVLNTFYTGSMPTGLVPSAWVNVDTAPEHSVVTWPVWPNVADVQQNYFPVARYGVDPDSTSISRIRITDSGVPGFKWTDSTPPYNSGSSPVPLILNWKVGAIVSNNPGWDFTEPPSALLGYTAWVQYPGQPWTLAPVTHNVYATKLYNSVWVESTMPNPPVALQPGELVGFKLVGPDGSTREFYGRVISAAEDDIPGRTKPNWFSSLYASYVAHIDPQQVSSSGYLKVVMYFGPNWLPSSEIIGAQIAGAAVSPTGSSDTNSILFTGGYASGLSDASFDNNAAIAYSPGTAGAYRAPTFINNFGWMTGYATGSGSYGFNISVTVNGGRTFQYTCTANGTTYPTGYLLSSGVWSGDVWRVLNCK